MLPERTSDISMPRRLDSHKSTENLFSQIRLFCGQFTLELSVQAIFNYVIVGSEVTNNGVALRKEFTRYSGRAFPPRRK